MFSETRDFNHGVVHASMMDQNLGKLVNFFGNRTSDLPTFELELGSKPFNDLRSHIMAYKIGRSKYLKLLNESQLNKLAKLAFTAVNVLENQL